MLTRRRLLETLAAMTATTAIPAPGRAGPGPRIDHTPPDFVVAAGTCDCHVHVFGPASRFSYAEDRVYTPDDAPLADLVRHLAAIKVDRVVIVQPSVYGGDNSCTLDGMHRLGSRARGVAVIDAATSRAALDEMQRSGIRGVRVNLATAGESDPSLARRNRLVRVPGRHEIDRIADRRPRFYQILVEPNGRD